MKPTRSLRLFAGSLTAFFVAHSAPAADFTWDNGTASGNWNTTQANFGGLWTNGNTAVFGGPAGSTVTIDEALISATGLTFNVNGDIINRTSTNNLTLTSPAIVSVGSGLTATINAPLAGSVGMTVDGGGILDLTGVSTIDGGTSGTLGLIVGATTANNTVKLFDGGKMVTTVTVNSTNKRSLYIGNSAFGGNSVVISTPGSVISPSFSVSGNGAQMLMGTSSSNNSLLVNNGAYFAQINGGGTNTWSIGTNAGANSNSITVTGVSGADRSTINFGSNQATNVGGAGDSNSVTVSAGANFITRRWLIGAGGGDSNNVVINGTGSLVTTSLTNTPSTNALFEIGSTAGSNGNYLSVEAGGAFNFAGSGTSRNFDIGRAGDNNYFAVTGLNSVSNIILPMPIALGGHVTGAATVTDGGTGNHLDINNGGAMVLTGAAVYVLGTNSAINLGNGTGTGTLTVGATTGYVAGIYLKNASGKLNINGGGLVAGASGSLVSGAGVVDLLGAASISTALTNSISTEITGSGSLTKEGTGTLDLTYANTYTGDTIVTLGTLQMENAYLADSAAVRMFTGGVMNLDTGATDTIGALYIDGVPKAAGIWGPLGSGATNESAFFTGSGRLNVVPVPEAAVALLGGLGLLTLLRRRRSE